MTRSAFVVGAGGAVGEATALALRADGWRVVASVHTKREKVEERLGAAGATIVHNTLGAGEDWRGEALECDALVFVTNLNITRVALEGVPRDRRIVVFSSNNVAADADAPSYRALAEHEAALRARFSNLAIVRPTLIYGDPRLVTVSRLLRMAETSPVLPLPGSGKARVQPVFHGDLGRLAAGLTNVDAPAGVFAVGGPDVVTMRALYQMTAACVGRSRVIVPTPGLVLKLAQAAGVVSEEQVKRAERDRVAVVQDDLPEALGPRTSLREGLALHFSAMGGSPGGGRS
jgi:NADH dehydrogenase